MLFLLSSKHCTLIFWFCNNCFSSWHWKIWSLFFISNNENCKIELFLTSPKCLSGKAVKLLMAACAWLTKLFLLATVTAGGSFFLPGCYLVQQLPLLMANRDCYHLLLVLAASFSWIYAYQIVCSCQCWRQFLTWLFSKTAVVIANGWNLDCLYMSLTAVAYMISWPAYLIVWGCHNWWHHFLTWLFLGTAVAVINCDLITSLFISVISTVFA